MKITHIGHSCFKIEFDGGKVLVTDPYDPSVGYPMPKIRADIATLSHGHYDHNYTAALSGNVKIFGSQCDTVADGISLRTVLSFHDNGQGRLRGKNLIFVIKAEGLTLCHLGDLGEDLNPAIIREIGKADILFIPVGGTYTLDYAQAAEYADAINPAVVIPMHYKESGCCLDIDGLDKFLERYRRFGEYGEININANNLNEFTKVVVLKRRENV